MKLGWAALGCVLALSVLMPGTAAAQSGGPPVGQQQQPPGTLKQNYPNPFNPETRIPFRIGDFPACSDARTHRVSLRVYNVLAQLVAVPMIEGGSGRAGGQALENVELPCGEYTAYWDGKFLNTGREVASGLYIYQLVVDGRVVSSKKMVVTK